MDASSVINQVWAFLFYNQRTFRREVMRDGTTMEVGLKRHEVESLVKDNLGSIVEEIITCHDWDFACDETTLSSTANTHTYTLPGKNADCRDLISVRYGSGYGNVLEERNQLELDRELSDEDEDSTIDTGGIYCYAQQARSDDGFPVIRLYNTPLTGDTIRYRYRRKGLTIENIPDEFGYVIVEMMLGRLDRNLLPLAEQRLRQMIDRYTVRGDMYAKVRMNPDTREGNRRRSNDLPGGM